MSVRRIKWVLGTRLILSLYIPWSLFFVSCTTWHSHPSCSLLLAQQLISRRLHPKSARTLLTPLVYFKVAARASYWAPLSPSRHANTERFVFCSVAPCLIPFPESPSYFSNSGLVRSCQHPFPWEPVNKQRRAYVHPLSCFYHLFLRRTLGIPSSMTHHGADCPPRQSGSSRGENTLTTTSPASSNFCQYFLLRLFLCCVPNPCLSQ